MQRGRKREEKKRRDEAIEVYSRKDNNFLNACNKGEDILTSFFELILLAKPMEHNGKAFKVK